MVLVEMVDYSEPYGQTPRSTPASGAENCVLCKVAPKTLPRSDVYGFTPRSILWREVVDSIARRDVSVSLGAHRRSRFRSVLLHPPSLASAPPRVTARFSPQRLRRGGGQPLGHLSVSRINDLRAVRETLSPTPSTSGAVLRSRLHWWLTPARTAVHRNCARPPDVPRSLTSILLTLPLSRSSAKSRLRRQWRDKPDGKAL
jgi:hypothetical protein